MVVKKPTKSLKSRKKPAKEVLYPTTVASTVGSEWGIRYTESDGLAELLRLLCKEGVEYDAMARIIRGYLDGEHNL